MKKLQSYKELLVWQRAIELAKTVYSCTAPFPREEIYGITSQMRRAAVSIACNIAEGQARRTKGEFLQFLGIAKGSLAELETLLEISKGLKFLKEKDYQLLSAECVEIHKMLHGLIRSLRNSG